MSLDYIFSFCNVLALIGWLALALAPVGRAYIINFARGIALVLAIGYVLQFFLVTEPVEGGSFTTLAGVAALFSLPGNVMLGWSHYLAFDLFIGSWQVEDSDRMRVPHWLVIPCLALTFMLGPIGLLLYFFARSAARVTRGPQKDSAPWINPSSEPLT
ncbi:MAG: ABA4-like family protein [Sphingomonadaceae bacterium]